MKLSCNHVPAANVPKQVGVVNFSYLIWNVYLERLGQLCSEAILSEREARKSASERTSSSDSVVAAKGASRSSCGSSKQRERLAAVAAAGADDAADVNGGVAPMANSSTSSTLF